MVKFMEKIKRFFTWVAVDGLLHIETVALIILYFTPLVGFLWASLIAAIVCIGREVIQFLKKKNTKEQVHHDMICNVIGYILGSIAVGFWHINFYLL